MGSTFPAQTDTTKKDRTMADTTQLVKLEQIRFDATTQPRVQLDMGTIEDYASAMADGEPFPPIELIQDREIDTYWVWDGYHRYMAAQNLGHKEILAHVIPGTLADAQWLSTAANKQHTAMRRTNADKRRAVQMALRCPKGRELSDREIARHCGVDMKTVCKYREQLELSEEIPQIANRTVTRGGTTYKMDVSNIGSTPRETEPKPALDKSLDNTAGVAAAPVTPEPAAPAANADLLINMSAPWDERRAQKLGQLHGVIGSDMLDIAASMEPGSVGTIITMPPIPYAPIDMPADFEYCAIYGQVARIAARLLRPKGTAIVLVGPRELPHALREMIPHLTYRWTATYGVPGGYAVAHLPRRVSSYCMFAVIMFNGEREDEICDDIVIHDMVDAAMGLASEEHVDWSESIPGLAGVVGWTEHKNLILDPCCGSSRIGEAALRTGRDFLGFEADPERAGEVRRELADLLSAGEDA